MNIKLYAAISVTVRAGVTFIKSLMSATPIASRAAPVCAVKLAEISCKFSVFLRAVTTTSSSWLLLLFDLLVGVMSSCAYAIPPRTKGNVDNNVIM